MTGALAENGTEMRNDNMVVLPRSNKQYSGDLHVPQTVRNLTYVGAPHVTRFGDNYPTRMLVLDDNYEIVHEVLLKTPRKHMIDITSIADLETLTVEAGDAARIRVSLPSGSEEGWPALEAGVMAWARSRGVSVASVDALVDVGVGGQTYNTDIDPEEILHDFCKGEELSEDLVAVGLALLKAARG